ncbi:xanthine dehydrogenase family protein subunit M [Microbacteriaceae bacterium K1510]|nr:xanthine dehydrogenase family protein subunit M [Microbacteriaceae bacterium K1510]
MHPAKFNYLRANSFAEASAALLDGGDAAKVLAGGQTLIPMMKLRLLRPELLVDLGGIAEGRDITVDQDVVEIGALARHTDIGNKFRRQNLFPIISDCALGIADAQVRNMGTIGGSLAEADPCSCWPALLVALDAAVLLEGPEGGRALRVRDLLCDAYTPDLNPGELITRVAVERAALAGTGTFVAFKRAAPAYPTASVALQVDYDGDRIATLRLGFGCLGLTALAFDAAEDLARGRRVTPALIEELAQAAFEFVEPIEDAKGSEAYKRSLTAGLVARAFGIVEARRTGSPALETHQYYG